MNTAAKITSIKQEKATKLAATFSADVTGIKDTDIKIVRDETKATVTVKKVTVDAKDNTKATIETYEALTDGKTYTVTYTATDEAKTESSANFTATTGVVKDLALNTYTIPANTLTEIKYQTLDANGVVIAEAGIGSSAANNMEITVENTNGYQNNNELLLYKTGDTATVKVVYHTYKYNNTDSTEEGKVDKTFTITAVDQSTVIKTFDYTVAEVGAAVDFKRDKLIHQLAVEDDTMADPHVYFSFRTASDKNITKSLDYTVTSGNENVLLASGTVAGGAKLTPVGVGATYLVIKDASGKIVTTLPINVVSKRSLATMSVDKSTVTIAQNAAAAGSQKITVAVMDQYSDNYSKYEIDQPVLRSNNNPGNLSVVAAKNTVNNTHKTVITVSTTGTGATDGIYSYTMDISDSANANNVKKISFTVIVSKVLAGQNQFALVMMNTAQNTVISKVDTTVTANPYSATTLKPTIVTKNNGSITGVAGAEIVSIGALKLTKNGGTTVKNTGIYAPTADGAMSSAQVIVSTGDGKDGGVVKKNLEAGTYTVSFKAAIDTSTTLDGIADKVQDMSTSFVVEDSQKLFEVSVKKESVSGGKTNLAEVFNDTEYVTFSYAGQELDKNQYNYSYVSADTTNVNSKSIRVNKVTMNVVLPGTNGKTVQMTTAVNRTFTFGTSVSDGNIVKTSMVNFEKNYVSGGALKVATTTNSAIITDYCNINNNYALLSSAEKTTLAASRSAIEGYAKKVAANIFEGVADGSYPTSKLNTNIFTVLGVTGANASEFANYQKLLAVTSTVTTSAIQKVVEEAPVLCSVSVTTGGSIAATGVAVTVTKTTDGAKINVASDLTSDTGDGIGSDAALAAGKKVYNLKASVSGTSGTITIKCTTYKVVYTIETDSNKVATSIAVEYDEVS